MPPRSWGPVLAIVALAVVVSLALGSSYPLLDPDEGRNAEVSREMATSGDFVIPHLAGMPYLDKPPALFWATAVAIRALGRSPLAVRLPAAVAAALTLLLLARLGLVEADAALALRATLLAAAAPLFAALSAYVIFDMPLTLCVTAIWTGLVGEIAHGPGARRRAAMFAALALGLLLKGPVMLAWAAGGSLASALLLRRGEPLRWLGWWPGWLLVLATAGGWFALATARHPEYPHYAFVEESFERLTSGSFHREQPWWFAPAVLVGGALPWSLATPWPTRRLRSPDARRGLSARVALGFVLFAAVFFTLSRSKLVSYLLPAIPPLAWLAAVAWHDAGPQRRSGTILFGLYVGLSAYLVADGIMGAALQGDPPAVTAAYNAMAIAFALVAVVALLGAIARRPMVAFATTLAFAPIVLVLGRPVVLRSPGVESGAPLARAVAALGGTPVRYEACYSPGTDFLLGRGSTLVTDTGGETTSNYQLRYRGTLIARGLWTPLTAPPSPDAGGVIIVRPTLLSGSPPRGATEFYRDQRFVAYWRNRQ